jgi:hypothetical protein
MSELFAHNEGGYDDCDRLPRYVDSSWRWARYRQHGSVLGRRKSPARGRQVCLSHPRRRRASNYRRLVTDASADWPRISNTHVRDRRGCDHTAYGISGHNHDRIGTHVRSAARPRFQLLVGLAPTDLVLGGRWLRHCGGQSL